VIVTMKMEGSKELRRDLQRISKEKRAQIKKETYASGLDVKKRAMKNLKERESWDTGNLANSILAEQSGDGETCEIGPTAPYGPYVEFGTKKHFPPLDALEDWARRHGFDSAWPICKAIAERGLPARPYLLPAFLDVEKKYFENLKRILRK